MNNPELSIIIPTYNCENYIAGCIDSILAQKGSTAFEIIVLDDGSGDKTLSVLNEFTKKHKNIRVIRQFHKGVSAMRNIGIQEAHGKYIFFMDGDDMVGYDTHAPSYQDFVSTDKNKCQLLSKIQLGQAVFPGKDDFSDEYFSTLLNTARKTKADITLGGKITVNYHNDSLTLRNFVKQKLYNKRIHHLRHDFQRYSKTKHNRDFKEMLDYAQTHEGPYSVLYRREMLIKHNLRFAENMNLDEDILFLMQSVLYANKVTTAPNAVYIYNRRRDSLSNAPDDKTQAERTKIAKLQVYAKFLSELVKFPKYANLAIYYMKLYSELGTKNPDIADQCPMEFCQYCGEQTCERCPIFYDFMAKLPNILSRQNFQR